MYFIKLTCHISKSSKRFLNAFSNGQIIRHIICINLLDPNVMLMFLLCPFLCAILNNTLTSNCLLMNNLYMPTFESVVFFSNYLTKHCSTIVGVLTLWVPITQRRCSHVTQADSAFATAVHKYVALVWMALSSSDNFCQFLHVGGLDVYNIWKHTVKELEASCSNTMQFKCY